MERQLTFAPHGHILTNVGVWTRDGRWVVYDVRSDPAGNDFDGTRIEAVHADTGEIRVLYESRDGACCGVATCSPVDDRIVFIHGPEHPTPDWSYSACHRRGVVVDFHNPGSATNLDACDVVPPFTPGALRGGSHVHTFSADGSLVAFTYEDHVLTTLGQTARNIGVCLPRPVAVPKSHPRNHDGTHFGVLVTRTDELVRAFEDAWIGRSRSMAFLGQFPSGIVEVFAVDLPDDLTVPGDGPLEGTVLTLPSPPRNCVARRLMWTGRRKHPGVQGPRHWPRSAPDGSRIAFLMRDDEGVVQLHFVTPDGGDASQVTQNDQSVASAFTWTPCGRFIAHVMDNSVCLTDMTTGATQRVTPRCDDSLSPRPEACVVSPDGTRAAYVRHLEGWNQVFVADAH